MVKDPSVTPQDGEIYGPHSRCFQIEHSDFEGLHAKCYQAAVNGDLSQCNNGVIEVKTTASETGYFCFRSGEMVEMDNGHKLKCPNVELFCSYFSRRCPKDCSGNGYCLADQNCFCLNGFSGEDCVSRGLIQNTCDDCEQVEDEFVLSNEVGQDYDFGFDDIDLDDEWTESLGNFDLGEAEPAEEFQP